MIGKTERRGLEIKNWVRLLNLKSTEDLNCNKSYIGNILVGFDHSQIFITSSKYALSSVAFQFNS